MGNYRFRLSEVIPNAWFYKLKDMGKTRNQKKTSQTKKKKSSLTTKPFTTPPPNREKIQNSPTNPKASDTHFPDPPRKSKRRSKRRSHRSSKLLLTSSVSAGCSLKHPFDAASWASSCTCRLTSTANDIIIDIGSSKCSFNTEFKCFDSVSELSLPPILTKPALKFDDLILDIKVKETDESTKFGRGTAKFEKTSTHGSLCVKVGKEGSIKKLKEEKSPPLRSSSVSSSSSSLKAASQRVKIRTNTPKPSSRKTTEACNQMSRLRRKNLSESYAIIKPSIDPQRDFKESMVEMITENNIRASKDLEDLLACYLSLNSNEYHDVIVNVFERIWFDLNNIRL